jgi:hypothetical protein
MTDLLPIVRGNATVALDRADKKMRSIRSMRTALTRLLEPVQDGISVRAVNLTGGTPAFTKRMIQYMNR